MHAASRKNFALSTADLLLFMRTAAATVLSLLAARYLRLPEFYWAPISTLVVLLSPINPLESSWQRFAGTAVGATLGALVATFFGPTWMIYGLSVAVCGLLCSLLRIAAAYRIAAITLSIVLLIAHPRAPWTVAVHRFVEVSLGIAIALMVASLWRLPRNNAG